jgi:hypothetical protein
MNGKISESAIERHLEGTGYGLSLGIILSLCLPEVRNITKTSVSTAGLQIEI